MSGNKILRTTHDVTEFEYLKQPVESIKSKISFSSLNDPDTLEEIINIKQASEVKKTKIPLISLLTDSPYYFSIPNEKSSKTYNIWGELIERVQRS